MIKQVILQVVLAHVIAMRVLDRHMCIHRRVKCLHARNRTSDLDLLNARRSYCSRKKTTTTRTICLWKNIKSKRILVWSSRERERTKRLSVSPRFFLDLLRREYSSCFVCSILCDKCLLDIWTSITIEGLSFILNFLGFLYLSRENKGDYALQDIYTALHWLKNYVTNFNGDPDRITLYGTGSGAVLASLVVMLETVNGLCQMKSSSSKKKSICRV